MNLDETYDFRNTRWGMTKKEVLAAEPDMPVVNTDNQIGYFTQILDKNIYVAFVFDNEHLVSTLYALRDMREKLEDSFKDFEDFKQILTMKYGEPNSGQGDVWTDPSQGNKDTLKALLQNKQANSKTLALAEYCNEGMV